MKRAKESSSAEYIMSMVPFQKTSWDPEAELMKAILVLSIADLRKEGYAKKQAIAFISSKESDYLFSFESICVRLGLNAQSVREQLIKCNSMKFERRRKKFKSELNEDKKAA